MKLFVRVTFIVLILTSLFSSVTFCATGFSGDDLDISLCPGDQLPPLAVVDEITNDLSDNHNEFKKHNVEAVYFCFNAKDVLTFLLTSNYSTISFSSTPIVNPMLKNIPLARDSLVL